MTTKERTLQSMIDADSAMTAAERQNLATAYVFRNHWMNGDGMVTCLHCAPNSLYRAILRDGTAMMHATSSDVWEFTTIPCEDCGK